MKIKCKIIIIFLLLNVFLLGFEASAKETKLKSIKLGNIVITPSRMVQYKSKTSSNVTVIGKQDIKSSPADNITDILEEEVGLNVYSSSTEKTAKVDIRGFADTSVSNVLVLIDGRKVNSIDMSGPDWMQIPLESVKRVEVIRGAGSVLYGDNAVGGVVNIITKKGKGKISINTGVKAGSYNMHQENIEVSGSQNDFSYYLFSRYYDIDGYRTNSNVLSKDYNTRLGYKPYNNISLDLAMGWHKDNYGMPGGLNNQGVLDAHGRRGSVNKNDYASTKDRYIKFSVDANPNFSDTDLNNFKMNIFYRNRDSYSWFDYGTEGTRATKYMIDTKGFNGKYIYKGDLFDKNIDFITGMDYYDVEHIIKGSGKGAMASSYDITIFKEELGFYANSNCELLDELFIDTGIRYQEAEYRFDQRAATDKYVTKNPSETVFSGGLKYNYDDESNIHASIEKTFRFLATDEWYSTRSGLNTSLKQQKGIQYEIGVKHMFSNGIMMSFTPYLIDIEDEIYLNPYPSLGQNENYDKTRRKGIELSSKMNLLDYLNKTYKSNLDEFSLDINYTYQEAEFVKGEYKGNEIPMVPQNLANIGIDVGFFEKFKLSLLGKYVGKRYAINDTRNETSKVQSYFTLDSKLSYNYKQFEIYLAVNNIFAEEYSTYVVKSTSSVSKDYYPAPERNFEVGINYKF